jgi:alpha-L-fucosidase
MNRNPLVSTFLAAGLLLAASLSVAQAQNSAPVTQKDHTPMTAAQTPETPAQHDARMKWWREARFGMFVHWGLYAVPAGQWHGKPVPGRAVNTQGYGEWIMDNAMIPVAEYAKLAPEFDPVKFDADAWAKTAQDAGMKYLIFTAKHHDGFAMFDSKASPFNIVDDTPFKRDPVAELARACRKHGIKFGIYYSQSQDWSHPGGAAWDGHWDPAQDGDYDAYLTHIAVPQVRELLSHYGPISVLWFDTDADMTPQRAAPFVDALKLQPGIIINNRLGGGVQGDTETPEQHIPATGFPGRDWEACMTINDTWGYRSDDTNFKSIDDLTRNLIDTASKGGNYLLNVGPDAQGIIPTPEVARLKAMGAWLKVNGDAIYGTSASPFKRLPFDGRATVKGDTLYLHVFRWPDSSLTLTGLTTPVRSAKALATGQTLSVAKADDGTLTISKPTHLDPVATVIALHLTGRPEVTDQAPVVRPTADGPLLLTADDAEVVALPTINGGARTATAAPETRGGQSSIGFWTDPRDIIQWTVVVPAPGHYKVQIEYSCPPDSAGATYAVTLDGTTPQGVTGAVTSTGSWDNFQTIALDGSVVLTAGKHTLNVVPQKMSSFAVMNLRRVVLTPIPTP